MSDAALNRWIIDSATDFAIIATDPAGRVTAWNVGACNVLGWGEAEMLGQTLERIFTPEDLAVDRMAEEMACALQKGAGSDERWHLRRDGARFWASGQITPLRDDADLIVGFVKVLRDRTEQRMATEALRGGQANIRLLLDSIAEGFYAVDRAGATTVCNAAFLRMMGFAREEDAVGRKLHDVIHHSHPDGAHYEVGHCPIYACAQNGAAAHVAEELFFPIDGPPLWVEYWATPIVLNGELQGAICSFLDITERKAAEDARRASDAQLRALNADLESQVMARARERAVTWNVTPDLLAVLTREGRFAATNPAWLTTLGWSAEELAAERLSAFVHPGELARNEEAFAALLLGRPVLRFENRYLHKAGGFRWLSWVAVPEGEKIYYSAREITEEKAAAEALEKAQDALRQSQKLEAIGQLTGGVAHDFNNLLTVIRGSVDLLQRPGLTEERRARYVDAIADTVDRAARLTGQLLAFARRSALKPQTFDVAANIRALREMAGTLVGSRISIDIRTPDGPCLVDADPSQFDTAVVNMAANARDAMGGRGTLSIVVDVVDGMPPIRAHPATSGRFVTVAITDTGPGIAPEDVDHVFEPFFTTKSVGEGTGLGLSQVFGFAKQSGGEVVVESKAGEGATLRLYLPQTTTRSAGDVASTAGQAEDGQGACILVVEDNAAVGGFATQALAELGYATVFASNGEAALAELGKGAARFDAIFSDVVMPGMGGIELARQVRRAYPSLPVVLTSGYSHVIAQQGTDGFELVHKPYSLDELSRSLKRATRNRRHDPPGDA